MVVALRADHLADLATHTGFSRLVERGMYLVGGLDEEGLRTAVETPARQAGLLIEPGLVDLLVREVRNDPGALPLMSHALLETWKRREGSTLTVAGYRASGGINGAVAQSAEGLYSRVEVEQRHLLRDLVLRLVSPGPEGEPVRTRVPRRLVGTDPEHEQLIEMLVAARSGHQRRRRPRDHPRSPHPSLAPAPRLARRRRRGPTDPSPPLGRRRRLGGARPS